MAQDYQQVAEVHLTTMSESMRKLISSSRIGDKHESSLSVKLQAANMSRAAMELYSIFEALRKLYAETDLPAIDARIDAEIQEYVRNGHLRPTKVAKNGDEPARENDEEGAEGSAPLASDQDDSAAGLERALQDYTRTIDALVSNREKRLR